MQLSYTTYRRYDIDWLRVIAIGLLLIYHVAIGFQSWGIMIGFITNDKPWESLWIPMAMLNIWRIPLLFFVSGMGVFFAIQNRSWKLLLMERSQRILFPFLFGIVFIVPIHTFIWQQFYHLDPTYIPNPGHLWFLGNIFIYVLVLFPVFFYLKRNEDGKIGYWIKKSLSNPLGFFLIIAAFIAEVIMVNPNPYTLYAMTWHGFFLGIVAFFFGFLLAFSGRPFWEMVLKWRWLYFSAAAIFFIFRLVQYQLNAPGYLLVIESCCWIFAVFGFCNKNLNRPSTTLSYLNQAVYPIYIVHMIFLYFGSMLIFPLEIGAPLKFLLVLLFTAVGCFSTYEFGIRRINILRPFFGLKKIKEKQPIMQ